MNDVATQLDAMRTWRRSWLLSETRTYGDIVLRKNGTELDMWIRINGEPQRFSVNQAELVDFLTASNDVMRTLSAASDNNTEEIE